MNPQISDISEIGDVYKFTISNLHVSLANAIRRTILSDIPTLAFYTETYNDNQCNIQINTTRLHNEILKQRLSCIPVHEKDLNILPGAYILDLDIKNETENKIVVTTEHFRIRNKTNGNYLSSDETKRIFPPNPRTLQFIDFARVRPKLADNIPGEHIKLTAEFSVRTAKENSMFNVVSKCSYGNTVDISKSKEVWDALEEKLREEKEEEEEIKFQKNNFRLLDSHRHFIENSFDFVIQTIGVFENKYIVKTACQVLISKFEKLIHDLDSRLVSILNSETTIDYCYDVILEDEDYTIGKVLEYIIYETYYVGDKSLTFCGFKKFHPHNPDSTLRMAFKEASDIDRTSSYVKDACNQAVQVFKKIHDNLP